MMYLTLDFGNTNPNFALFRESELVTSNLMGELENTLKKYDLSFGDIEAVASIVGHSEDVQNLEREGLHITKIRDWWKNPMFAGVKINYATTLGDDRLITNWFVAKYAKVPTLVIDCGTFTTIDVCKPREFSGGFILPGIKTLLNSYAHGEKLPTLSTEQIIHSKNFLTELPQKTEEAIAGSVIFCHSFIENVSKNHHIGEIILTGGHADSMQAILKQISMDIPLQTAPHLIHTALCNWFLKNIKGL